MTVSGLLFFLLLTSVFVFVLLDPFCLGKLETVLLCRNELKNADNCPKCKDSCKRNSSVSIIGFLSFFYDTILNMKMKL